jgi:predicted TIM-barrel fold metal-dependent hydrolase
MDTVGVEEAVVVGYPLGEWTDNWYTEAAASHDRLHGVVLLDPLAAGSAATLRRSMATDGVIGFRLGVMCPRESMWTSFDTKAQWLPDAVEAADFWWTARETDAVVQLLAHESQLDQVQTLVERYPSLTYVIDHFASTSPETPPSTGDFAQLSALAEHDHTVAKVSGVQKRSSEPFPYPDMHDHVTWLVEAFGRERVVWGSDFPNVSDESTYADSLDWLEHVETLSSTEQRWLREKAARALLRG